MMTTEAVFEYIPERIAQELRQAQQSICVAVAWLTREDLFGILLHQARSGVTVQLALSNDFINRDSRLDHDALNQYPNAATHWIGDGETELMHHKFCVIDKQVVITGSFNWSKRAERNNHENITISRDSLLAQAFYQQFYHLIGQPTPTDSSTLPLDVIIKRLEILKNYVALQDMDDISRENNKLKNFDTQPDIAKIYHSVKALQFSQAIDLIDDFIKKYHSVTIYQDVDLMALKLEIRLLEHQIEILDAEKIELEKLLADFNYQHDMTLGDLIGEILTLKKQIAKQHNDEQAYQEAEQDEKIYNDILDEQKSKVRYTLDKNEQKQLKQAYRKASQLCHPDRVNDAQKHLAEQVFAELRQAYESNDLAKIQQILSDVQQGIFKTRTQTVGKLDTLRLIKQELNKKLQQTQVDIDNIKNSESYQIIIKIDDWDDYFAKQKQLLSHQRDELERQLQKTPS